LTKDDIYSKEEKKVARRLLGENQKRHRSWRKISQEDYRGKIKPGTLCSIGKGKFFPTNPEIRILLGVPPKVCRLCHQKITIPRKIKAYRCLDELSNNEIVYLLKHRESLDE
jgi:hypothetical protein